jgi:hypothetical protein
VPLTGSILFNVDVLALCEVARNIASTLLFRPLLPRIRRPFNGRSGSLSAEQHTEVTRANRPPVPNGQVYSKKLKTEQSKKDEQEHHPSRLSHVCLSRSVTKRSLRSCVFKRVAPTLHITLGRGTLNTPAC